MKKLILLIFICFFTILLIAQDITISFRPKVTGTLIDSIWVINQRTGQAIKLTGNDSLILTKATGIIQAADGQFTGSVYPNPSNGEVNLSFTSGIPEKVRVEVYSVLGQLLATSKQDLNPGRHIYRISFPGEGIFFVSVFKNNGQLTFKTFQMATEKTECSIIYTGSESSIQLKNGNSEKTLNFERGDLLYCSAHSGNNTTILTDSPGSDMIYFIDFFACIDADKRNYKVVVIDKMIWMAENLAYLPAVSPSSEGSLTEPFYYVNGYNGTNMGEAKATDNYKTYGVLYNWTAAKAACPVGWRLPTDAEWKKLEMALGMTQEQADTTGLRGSDQGTKMKTTSGWYKNGNGTNAAGFSGLPAGMRASNGYFYYLGQRGYWWSSSDFLTAFACYRNVAFDATGVTRTTTAKDWGFAVRCVKY
jgi:uncharacterized protein (TIGR02145 family)